MRRSGSVARLTLNARRRERPRHPRQIVLTVYVALVALLRGVRPPPRGVAVSAIVGLVNLIVVIARHTLRLEVVLRRTAGDDVPVAVDPTGFPPETADHVRDVGVTPRGSQSVIRTWGGVGRAVVKLGVVIGDERERPLDGAERVGGNLAVLDLVELVGVCRVEETALIRTRDRRRAGASQARVRPDVGGLHRLFRHAFPFNARLTGVTRDVLTRVRRYALAINTCLPYVACNVGTRIDRSKRATCVERRQGNCHRHRGG